LDPDILGMRARGTRGRSWNPTKESRSAEIFVDLGPVDTFTIADQLAVVPLLRGGVEQARVPDQRHREGTPVSEGDDELVVRDADLLDAFISY